MMLRAPTQLIIARGRCSATRPVLAWNAAGCEAAPPSFWKAASRASPAATAPTAARAAAAQAQCCSSVSSIHCSTPSPDIDCRGGGNTRVRELANPHRKANTSAAECCKAQLLVSPSTQFNLWPWCPCSSAHLQSHGRGVPVRSQPAGLPCQGRQPLPRLC